MKRLHRTLCTIFSALALAGPIRTNGIPGLASQTTLNSYGLSGLIDLPTADTLPNGELALIPVTTSWRRAISVTSSAWLSRLGQRNNFASVRRGECFGL